MSGHSKWAQIRRSKGVNDAKRGQLFTRLGRELVVAVREGGGGDPDANFRLRMAIQRARAANMPADNLDRTAAEIRNVFNKNGGNLGEVGCVDWIFEQRGVVEVELDGKDPDELTLTAIDAGAEDVDTPGPDDTLLTLYTEP